ncbi:MAG: DUF1501 domain-containing protein [Planctomycetota bacterium]|jgi:hypothetical protein|nr:DUF1501 domain-containing protein [Planctomycetota bacterium]
MNPYQNLLAQQTRRYFLGSMSGGLGAIALQNLVSPTAMADVSNPLSPRLPHFAAKAKRVIYLHMTGSPPNLDLFDYKPKLVEMDGQEAPASVLAGKEFAFTTGVPKLLGTRHEFVKCGQSGMMLSDCIPHLQTVADELCMVHSLHTDQFNHAPAELMIYTGSPRSGRPSFGSWLTYGIGSENENLPAFVVLISSGVQPNGGKSSFGSGFLPSVYQGVQCRSQGDPVLYASDPSGMSRDLRRRTLDTLQDLNGYQVDELGHPETQTRIAQYELAFRMQTSVPDVMDISKESQETLDAYGAKAGAASLANNCLLARRLVESGVRYVQLFDWGWDFHGTGPAEDIRDGLTKKCETMDRPVAALIKDLKQRGLLDETLIIWGGEFGRTPFREGRTATGSVLGRDHYPNCFTMFMAGGGTKGGFDYGSTDELGFSIAENPVHIHDLQATWMHLLGFDHTKLTYRFQGRDYRLTDVHGNVVKPLLA